MKNITKKAFLGLCFFLLLLGCQRDDICPETTETTPLQNVFFYDAEDPTRLKAAQNLVVIAANMEDTLLGPTTTNAIEIPLRTNEDFTEYRFILNAGSESENEDVVTFSYNPVPEYLNRACGFKVDFLNMQVNQVSNENKWILSSSIIPENTENETEAHISFTH